MDGIAAAPESARHLGPHEVPRRQAEVPWRHAALHRVCAPGGATLSRARPASRPARRVRVVKALLLAGARGERLRPLTDRMPKPLVPVAGKPLLAWHLERLAASGCREGVANVLPLGGATVKYVENS